MKERKGEVEQNKQAAVVISILSALCVSVASVFIPELNSRVLP